MDRMLLISQDCHAGAPWFIYRKYLDPQYREAYDAWLARYMPGETDLPGDSVNTLPPYQIASLTEDRRKAYLAEIERSMGHLGNWDAEVRARELDREGIAGEVVFSDGSQKNHAPFRAGFVMGDRHKEPYELRRAGCRAHNRWLADFCAVNKGRHAGVALITTDNPADTVEDIRWAREHGLFGGIRLPALQLHTNGYESFWHHPRYEPIWQVCEELQMPVNTHASGSGIDYGAEGSPQVAPIEHAFTTFRPFWFLLWGGVFERHPGLKFCPTESGGMLVLWFNAYFDEYLAKHRRPEWTKKALKLAPSEYWHRQCYVGASAHSTRAEIDARAQIGVRNILWGSDYPHPEGTWPASRERLHSLFEGIPEAEVRQMAGGNAAQVYGFDLKQMNAIAARIGPSTQEICGTAAAVS